MCAAPFAGVGAALMRPIGKAPSVHNPTVCSSCFTFLASHHGGAEIEVTMLFADIRGSTALAETMSPFAFRDLMDRFYTVATAVVFDHDGTVDKFVGDELVAMFIPLLSGDDHAKQGRRGGDGTPAGDRTRGSGRSMGPDRRPACTRP